MKGSLRRIRRGVERAAPVLLAVGVVSLLELLVTIEWSSPSCTREYQSWNGPISATFGAPFPHMRWTLGSSLEFLVMVHVYLANLFLLSCAAYPFVRRFVVRAPRACSRSVLGGLGVGFLMLVGGMRALQLTGPSWRPVVSIAYAEPYTSFRPVGVDVLSPRTQCTPSAFWFGAP